MRVWHKIRQWFCGAVPKKATKPENAIAILRPDGSTYMHVWLDMTYTEPRVCMVFGGNLAGYKIKWSAHTLPQLKAAIEELMKVPLPPLKTTGQNS